LTLGETTVGVSGSQAFYSELGMSLIASAGRVFIGDDPVGGVSVAQQNISLAINGIDFDIAGKLFLQAQEMVQYLNNNYLIY
jgi:hypothetical protein